MRDGTAWRGLDEAMVKGLRHVVRDGTAWGKVKTVWGGFAIMGV